MPKKFFIFDSDDLKKIHKRVFFSIIVFLGFYFVAIFRIADVMVFDNIGQSTTVAMTDPDAIRTELKRLKSICRKYGVAFLLVAHHNKVDYSKEMELKNLDSLVKKTNLKPQN